MHEAVLVQPTVDVFPHWCKGCFGEGCQPNSEVMRVTRQAFSAATARLVFELKAQGQEESHDEFDKRLAIAKELTVGPNPTSVSPEAISR